MTRVKQFFSIRLDEFVQTISTVRNISEILDQLDIDKPITGHKVEETGYHPHAL